MTYLEYVNIMLQALNEVPLTSTQFGSARGLHQFAKESLNRAYFDIIQEFKWPWMQDNADLTLGDLELSGERTLVPASTWTAIPVPNPYRDSVQWSSIYYRDGDGNKLTLKHLDWEVYEDGQNYYDEASEPRYIVESADGRSMGLIPFPEANVGKLYYKIWARPSRFSVHSDIIPMPDLHHNVLVDAALHHMWTFRGDVDQAQIAYQRYEKGIKKMKQKYTNQSFRMRWA